MFLNLMTIVGQGGGSNQLCQILLSDQVRWGLRTDIGLSNIEFTGDLKGSSFSEIVGQETLVWVQKREWGELGSRNYR